MFAAASKTASSSAPSYIEDVFSTYLYTGNGSSQTIANGIDLTTYGGMVWIKDRTNAYNHVLTDTVRGATSQLYSNLTNAATTSSVYLSAFTSSGFSVGNSAPTNTSSANDVSWTFRKQPKFFDVVTYTGDGVTGRTINHNLQSIPGCVIIKRTDTTSEWLVWNQSDYFGAWYLNRTYAKGNWLASSAGITSTTMRVDGGVGPMPGGVTFDTNAVGGQYVAYLFAHNAGGFGTAGTDNVITCGSWTGSAADINLGYEPQWLLVKKNNSGWGWFIVDNMRGLYASPTNATYLMADTSAAETTAVNIKITSTGFTQAITGVGESAIYIAIRRGPMKTPTSGTSVFTPVTATASNNLSVTAGFPPDLAFVEARADGVTRNVIDRLRGGTTTSIISLESASTGAEQTYSGNGISFNSNSTGIIDNFTNFNQGAISMVYWMFRRAPSFMDEVCYSGNSSGLTINHNLTVKPELIIHKSRSNTSFWNVFAVQNGWGELNNTGAWGGTGNGSGTDTIWQATSTTVALDSTFASSFAITGRTYVIYLFASCAGVSKVGSYTGAGATQTISCGFAARFVLIKRTDSTGDWWVWDTARGMVAGTDPRLAFNLTSAETNANWVYTDASGFQIVTTDATVNASGGSYIFLAVA